ncbi:MAG: hypothetical protein CK548_06745, partial [Opitutia bacterium]
MGRAGERVAFCATDSGRQDISQHPNAGVARFAARWLFGPAEVESVSFPKFSPLMPAPTSPNPTTTMTRFFPRSLLAAGLAHPRRLLLPLLLAPLAFGQIAPALPVAKPDDQPAKTAPVAIVAAKDNAVVLSPFVIQSEKDTGYQASSMLQGGRGRIDLGDLATQVSVFTKDFLDDIGANNTEQAYLFSTNTSTYYDSVQSGGDNRTGAQVPYDVNNSRGLGALNKTRNFFRTAIEPDSYNTERLSLVSGSNAVQFGLGGAAGVSDSTSAQANLKRNRQQVRLSTDSYGSQRVSLDVNQVIFKNKLAVRAIGLRDNKEYFIQPGWEKNERLFVAATYQPFQRTTLRFEGEFVHRADARSGTTQTRDSGYMAWLATQAAGNPLVYVNRAATEPAAGRPAAPSYTLPTGIVGPYSFNTNPILYVWPQNSVPAFSGLQDMRNTVLASTPDLGGGASQSLVVSGYPWNVNPAGFSRYNFRNTERVSATLEQRLTNTTFLELAFAREKYRHKASHLMGDRPYDTMVDINKFLPNGVTPNPMYGRPFVETINANEVGGTGNMQGSVVSEYRATLAQSFDLTRSSGWLRHLGRHNLGLFSSYEDNASYLLGNMRFMILGEPSFLSAAAKANPLSLERQFNMRFYLPPIGSTDDPHAYGIPGLAPHGDVMEALTFTTASGEKYQVSQKRNPIGFVGAPSAAHFQRGSLATSTSSNFLDNHLVVNLGARYDRVRNSNFAAFIPIAATTPPTAANPFGGGLGAYSDFTQQIPPDIWTAYRTATRVNYGFIVRPPRVGDWLTFGYDRSKNASLEELARVTDINGTIVPPNYGESAEYSVRLRFLGGKLNTKFNFFSSLSRNVALTDGGLRANLINFERQLYENNPAYPINPLFKRELNLATANFRVPGERRSQGVDFEVNYNPSQHWRIFWNLGRTTTTVDDQAAQPWFDYLAAKLPTWKANGGNWATTPYVALAPTAQTVQSAYGTLIENALDDIYAALGNPGGNSQTWRSSLVATRSFTTGRLKGTTLGANFRYRGPSILGFPNIVDAKGRTQLDKRSVYKSEDYILTGLMGSYRFRATGETTWKVQLNANNIFNTKRVVLSRVYPDGTPRSFGRQPGREFMLSVDVER